MTKAPTGSIMPVVDGNLYHYSFTARPSADPVSWDDVKGDHRSGLVFATSDVRALYSVVCSLPSDLKLLGTNITVVLSEGDHGLV